MAIPPKLWHRDNALVLTGLLVVGATVAIKLTAGRELLQFFLPTAAIGMLLAILLDAYLATVVVGMVAIIGGAVNGGSLEFAAYVLPGRRPHRGDIVVPVETRHPAGRSRPWRPDGTSLGRPPTSCPPRDPRRTPRRGAGTTPSRPRRPRCANLERRPLGR